MTPNAQRFGTVDVSSIGTGEQMTRLGVGRGICLWHNKFPVSSFELSARSAFTLIELIVTIAISGIVILAIIAEFGEAMKGLAWQKAVRSATVLSEDMMHEIRSKNFTDPQTPGSFTNEEGVVRRDFDDVDDYNGWAKSPPETIEGAAMTNYSGFRRSVTVGYVNAADLDTPVTNVTSFKRIAVVVSNADVVITTVSVASEYD